MSACAHQICQVANVGRRRLPHFALRCVFGKSDPVLSSLLLVILDVHASVVGVVPVLTMATSSFPKDGVEANCWDAKEQNILRSCCEGQGKQAKRKTNQNGEWNEQQFLKTEPLNFADAYGQLPSLVNPLEFRESAVIIAINYKLGNRHGYPQ